MIKNTECFFKIEIYSNKKFKNFELKHHLVIRVIMTESIANLKTNIQIKTFALAWLY